MRIRLVCFYGAVNFPEFPYKKAELAFSRKGFMEFCGREVYYDQCSCGTKSSVDLYVCLPGLKYFSEDIFGNALPAYDKGSGQYGYHQQQAVKAV